MLKFPLHCSIVIICLLSAFANISIAQTEDSSDDAAKLFHSFANQVFQVQIIELASGNKSSIGSGFSLSQEGIVGTNFHVIAQAVHSPNQYKIELINDAGQIISAGIRNFDVVNDLALLNSEHQAPALQLAEQEPQQGETIYSIGNPHDYGMIVSPGTYNGLTEKSYYQRIHFTGSINSGMSGGPVLNQQGHIVGVNVATGKNNLGFLVPLSKLRDLVKQKQALTTDNYKSHIEASLTSSQNQLIDRLLSTSWQTTKLIEAEVPGQISPFLPCWGYSNADKKEQQYFSAGINCISNEQIFVDSRFTSGHVEMQFEWLQRKHLNTVQFYNLLESRLHGARGGNRAAESHVSNYFCQQDFIKVPQGPHTAKSIFCTRVYKDYPSLFDIMFINITNSDNQKALISHFTLSGISQTNAQLFSRRFLESIVWN